MYVFPPQRDSYRTQCEQLTKELKRLEKHLHLSDRFGGAEKVSTHPEVSNFSFAKS